MSRTFLASLEHFGLSGGSNFVSLARKPIRWDEYLDLDSPILIAHTCCSWEQLGQELWMSGLSNHKTIKLLDREQVVSIQISKRGFHRAPLGEKWTLALGFPYDEGVIPEP